MNDELKKKFAEWLILGMTEEMDLVTISETYQYFSIDKELHDDEVILEKDALDVLDWFKSAKIEVSFP